MHGCSQPASAEITGADAKNDKLELALTVLEKMTNLDTLTDTSRQSASDTVHYTAASMAVGCYNESPNKGLGSELLHKGQAVLCDWQPKDGPPRLGSELRDYEAAGDLGAQTLDCNARSRPVKVDAQRERIFLSEARRRGVLSSQVQKPSSDPHISNLG